MFWGGWGGGVVTTPTPMELKRGNIYIVEPGRDSKPVKGVGFLEISELGLEGFEGFFSCDK